MILHVESENTKRLFSNWVWFLRVVQDKAEAQDGHHPREVAKFR